MASPLEINLSCPVCLELFQDPLLLTCGHSFCRSCLEKICREPGEEEQRCPVCRHQISRQPAPNMDLRNATEAFQEERRFNDDITDPQLEDDDDNVPSSPADLRMVLVGKTGSGKSAAGNTILGREGFESEVSPESVTKECQIGEGRFESKTISVTDTPGVYDTDLREKALRLKLESFIDLTVPGPHVFLLVIRVGVKYSKEEKDAVQWICDNFGKEALQYTMVLFTHTDVLNGKPLEKYVDESSELKKLISDCGGRLHGFNNNVMNLNQVTQLLQKIECMVESNRLSGSEYYTNDVYKTAQRIRKAKEVGLVVTAGVGVVSTVAGVAVLGTVGIPVLSAGLIVAGAAMAGGAAIAKHQNENK